MDARQFYQGSEEWLKKDHLKKSDGTYAVINLVISGAEMAEYKDGSKHLALSFEGKDRKLGLNVTNYRTLESMYGFETDNWTGRTVIVYVDPSVSNPQGGEPGGIRIRYEPPVDSGDPGPDVDF